VTEEKTIKCN